MFGVVTRNPEELDWPEFDRGFYEMKDVTGRATEPVEMGVNMISCFGDSTAAENDPSLIPVSDEGELATREQPYFDWGYICPTREAYREGLLEMVSDAAEAYPDVRLDDIGFPRAEYCHCEQCETAFEESDYDDWYAWRANVITEFVAEAPTESPARRT